MFTGHLLMIPRRRSIFVSPNSKHIPGHLDTNCWFLLLHLLWHVFLIYLLVNVYIAMENHCFWWVNPLFQWPFSIAFCMFTRGYLLLNPIKPPFSYGFPMVFLWKRVHTPFPLAHGGAKAVSSRDVRWWLRPGANLPRLEAFELRG